MQGEIVKLWGATAVAAAAPDLGTVLRADAEGIVVSARDGAVNISELQRPGGRRLSAADFLRGFALPVGTVLGSA
jgi:methionyl-tRNA formyltransferase